MRVAIIGAGWAGLAAGIQLSAAGASVSLFEAAQLAGGRARSVKHGELAIDNGQHLFLGAYHELWRLLKQIGLDASIYFSRRSLRLQMTGVNDADDMDLFTPNLPRPLHLLFAIMYAEGFSWREKLQLTRATHRMLRMQLADDCSVDQLLEQCQQPARAQRLLWQPLCLAALNTPSDQSSAKVFLKVLHDVFGGDSKSSQLLFAETDLGKIFPRPALRFMKQRGAQFYFNTRVTSIAPEQDGIVVCPKQGALQHVDHVIIATAPHAATQLLAPIDATAALATQLQQLGGQPITTVYLQYAPRAQLEFSLLGVQARYTQWLIDRSMCGQQGLIAAVISGAGPHMQLSKQDLAQAVAEEIADLFPDWPLPRSSYVLREKYATFACTPGIDQRRPDNRTAHPRIWLAGDYTNTQLPATLESAVRSGSRCAQAILAITPSSALVS